jgi:DeoR/GlpR family transcriptional regulator of sugar metabolism
MLVDERRHLIAEIVITQGAATVAALSQRFSVSHVTIRSDLEALERQGTLTRNRGGAVANTIARFIPAFQKQSSVNRDAKQAIARKAAALVQDGDWIILDSGSTTLYVAEEFSRRRLVVAANSVYSMNKLVEMHGIDIILIGGSLYRPSLSYVGNAAEEFLDRMSFDKVLLGVNGISERGVSVNNPDEAGIKRKMMERARQVIVLADASKLDLNSFVLLEPLDHVNVLVTDSPASSPPLRRLQRAHPSLEVIHA